MDEVARALAVARFLRPLGGVDIDGMGTRRESIDGMGVDGRCDGVDGAGFHGSLGSGDAHRFLDKGNFEDAGGYMDKDVGGSRMRPMRRGSCPPPSPPPTVGGKLAGCPGVDRCGDDGYGEQESIDSVGSHVEVRRRCMVVRGLLFDLFVGIGPTAIENMQDGEYFDERFYDSICVELQPALDDAEFDDALLSLHLSVAAQGTCRGSCDDPVPMVIERRHRDPRRRST